MTTQPQRDELTGALTRGYLERELAAMFGAGRDARRGALIVLDIDRFGGANQRWGRSICDLLLRMVGERVEQISGEDDFVARYGADEFAVVCRGAKPAYASQLAHRFRARVADIPFEITRGGGYFFTVSLGVASFPADDILSARDVCIAAERALGSAKSEGGNCVRIAGTRSAGS